MFRPVEHSYIPDELIEKPEEPKERPNELDVINTPAVPYTEFEVLGDTSAPANLFEAFDIRDIPQGTLYISKKTVVEDMAGNMVPRSMLITPQGKEVFKKNPGILKKIDQQALKERYSKVDRAISESGVSGDVRIVNLSEEQTVAVKRFKRYKDGNKLYVGGLEQAEAHMILSDVYENSQELASAGIACRMAEILFASQDVVVMENIEELPTLKKFISQHPSAEKSVWEAVGRIHNVTTEAFQRTQIKGYYDRLQLELEDGVTQWGSEKHLFVENYDPETGQMSFVMIDPNI